MNDIPYGDGTGTQLRVGVAPATNIHVDSTFDTHHVFTDQTGLPMTGWLCVICYEYAQVMMQSMTFCKDHAKRYHFGYGETIMDMLGEQKLKENKSP